MHYVPLECLPLHVIVAHKLDHLLLRFAAVAERAAARQHACLMPRNVLHRGAAEEAVILHALLPKVFTLVASLEEELDCIFIITLRK